MLHRMSMPVLVVAVALASLLQHRVAVANETVVADIKDLNRKAYFAAREVQRMRSVNEAAFYKLIEGVTDDLIIDANEAEFLQHLSTLQPGQVIQVVGLNDARSNFVMVPFNKQFAPQQREAFATLAAGEQVRDWHWQRRWFNDRAVVLELFLQRDQDPSWTDAFLQQQLKRDHANAVAAKDSGAITALYEKMGGSAAAHERITVEQEAAFRAYALAQFDAFAKTTVGQPGEIKNYSYLGELSTLRGLNQDTDDDGW